MKVKESNYLMSVVHLYILLKNKCYLNHKNINTTQQANKQTSTKRKTKEKKGEGNSGDRKYFRENHVVLLLCVISIGSYISKATIQDHSVRICSPFISFKNF